MPRTDYLINGQITPAVLATKPKLVDKYNPNPGRYAEILEVINVPGGRTCYRLLTWLERSLHGPAYWPAEVTTLSQVRFDYAAWITSDNDS